MKKKILGALACGAMAMLCGNASAMASTIGQTGGGPAFCVNELGPVVTDTTYVVPSGGGQITSFSFQSTSANAGEMVDFLVLRPLTGGGYQVIGKTGEETLQGTGAETFSPSAPIDVQAGDLIGVYIPGELANCLRQNDANTGGVAYGFTPTDPAVGSTVSPQGGPVPSLDLNESAQFASSQPTSGDQCKNGGWRSYGTLFKNQGDCVSFVATHGKNTPSGQ